MSATSNSLLTLELLNDVYRGTITIKIWIEAWDADAFDSIKKQTIITFFKFYGNLAEDV